MPPERRVHFAVLIQVRCDGPCAVILVEEEDHAFTDMDENADLTSASAIIVSSIAQAIRQKSIGLSLTL